MSDRIIVTNSTVDAPARLALGGEGCLSEGAFSPLIGQGLDMPPMSDLRWELRADGRLLGHIYIQKVNPDGRVDMVFYPLPKSAVAVPPTLPRTLPE